MAPSWTRFIASRMMGWRRQQKPLTSDRFFFLACSATACTLRTPGPSTAIGFSQKTCRPASMAAWRWIGRKPGGVASSTTSTLSITDL